MLISCVTVLYATQCLNKTKKTEGASQFSSGERILKISSDFMPFVGGPLFMRHGVEDVTKHFVVFFDSQGT